MLKTGELLPTKEAQGPWGAFEAWRPDHEDCSISGRDQGLPVGGLPAGHGLEWDESSPAFGPARGPAPTVIAIVAVVVVNAGVSVAMVVGIA